MLRRFLFALALLFPLAAHAQLPCAAYPFTLTNGTLADANQVMTNFNTVRNCVNSLSPLAVPVIGSASKIAASEPSASASITVTADTVTVGTALNGTSYTLTSYSQVFNGATTGAGGMDTGTLPGSSFVALYAIYNPAAPATSILGASCASSCPTVYAGGFLPAGYTASALLTTLPTNATPAIPAGTYVKGKNISLTVVTALNVATAHASPTTLSLATFSIPPNAISVSGALTSTCGTTPSGTNVNLSVSADTGNSGLQTEQFNCASVNGAANSAPFNNVLMPTAQTIFYTNAVAGTTPSSIIQVNGYQIP